MERKLASIQLIAEKEPINGADNIERVRVLGWWLIAKKGEFSVGDLCVFFEIDSILPDKDWSQFLKDKHFKVKTMRLNRFGGIISQGLALPLTIFTDYGESPFMIGDDVTEKLGVTKYEPPTPIQGNAKGNFPTNIPKTDEVRIQSAPHLLDELFALDYYVTVKLDGTSFTAYRDMDSELHVCSRNLEIKEEGGGVYWEMAHKYSLKERLPMGLAVQGEICGPGIQKNPLGLAHKELFIFTVFDLVAQERYGYDAMINMCISLNLQTVPVLTVGDYFNETVESLLELAKGTYANGGIREGIVIRSLKPYHSKDGSYLSFKVINNDYL